MKKINKKYINVVFVVFIFILCFTWAIIQPPNSAPDERMKFDICEYIAKYSKLPHGGEEVIRDKIWGISYGFTPILSYIIAGGFIKIVSAFTNSIEAFYIAARFVSVICITIMAIFNIKIGEKLFKNTAYKWIFVLLTTLLPQMAFIGSYINNDSLALMSISIIVYSWLIGLETKWNIKSSVLLGIGVGICALSYYNAYGFILLSVVVFIASFFTNKEKKFDFKNLIKKGLLIFAIAFLIAGWWFIRSAIIYNGDFLGLETSNEYGEKYAQEQYKPSKIRTPKREGRNLRYMLTTQGWLRTTIKSYIGVFGHLDIIMFNGYYFGYIIIFLAGILGYLIKFNKWKYFKELVIEKNKFLLEIVFIIAIIIPIILSIYYSYCSDFQPQGRYIMPMTIPAMYFVTLGLKNILENIIKNDKAKKIISTVLIFIGIIIPIMIVISTVKYY